MASVLLQKTPYDSFGGQPGGTLDKYKNKDLSSSVMDKEEELPMTAEELARQYAEKDAFKGAGLPTLDLGGVEFGISDFVTPGSLAKVAAVLKGVLAPAAAVSTAMLVGSRAAGPVSQLARSLSDEMGAIVGHASPYKFSKFDSSKLGEGQGTQSFGAGTYLAENPAVIKEYEKEFKLKKFLEFEARKSIAREEAWLAQPEPSPGYHKIARATIAKHKLGLSSGTIPFEPTTYKVDLPDEQIGKMLDWDKPLNQLSKKDREALSLIAEQEGLPVNYRGSNVLAGERKGEDFYNALVEKSGDKKQASAILNSYGIPGIKYLDEQSRLAGKGTSNFVVFEPELLKILESEAIK